MECQMNFKIGLFSLTFLFAAFLFAGEGTVKSKTLVVYFSRTGENYAVGNISEGNTAVLAKMIAEKVSADLFEVKPQKIYPEGYQECTEVAKAEREQKARPAYKGDVNTAPYDTVFVGYPIWWGDVPMVMYHFLEKHDLNGKVIVPFCTHEGSGSNGTATIIQEIFKQATVKSPLEIRGETAQKAHGDAEKEVENFLKTLNGD